MKKRIISVVLMMAMILSVGCKKKEKKESSESSESTTESTTEKTESVTESETAPSVTDTEPEEFSFDQTNIPGIQFCYSTAPMALSAYSVLLDISRQEASELIQDKSHKIDYGSEESCVALLPEISLDDSLLQKAGKKRQQNLWRPW